MRLGVDDDEGVKPVVQQGIVRDMAFKEALHAVIILSRVQRIAAAEPHGIGIHHKGREAKGVQQDGIRGLRPDALQGQQLPAQHFHGLPPDLFRVVPVQGIPVGQRLEAARLPGKRTRRPDDIP